MPKVGTLCEQLAGAMTAIEPIHAIGWTIVTDDLKVPLYLAFFVFGQDNVHKINDSLLAMNPAGFIKSENQLLAIGSVAESMLGGMDAAGRDAVHWIIPKDNAGRELYLLGFVRGNVHVPKMNQLLIRIRESGVLSKVAGDLGLPPLPLPDRPPQ